MFSISNEPLRTFCFLRSLILKENFIHKCKFTKITFQPKNFRLVYDYTSYPLHLKISFLLIFLLRRGSMACLTESRAEATLQGCSMCQTKDVFQNQGGAKKGRKGGHSDYHAGTKFG